MSATLELADKVLNVFVLASMVIVTGWVFWLYLSSMARGIAAMLRHEPAAAGQVMPLANQPGTQAVFNKID